MTRALLVVDTTGGDKYPVSNTIAIPALTGEGFGAPPLTPPLRFVSVSPTAPIPPANPALSPAANPAGGLRPGLLRGRLTGDCKLERPSPPRAPPAPPRLSPRCGRAVHSRKKSPKGM